MKKKTTTAKKITKGKQNSVGSAKLKMQDPPLTTREARYIGNVSINEEVEGA